MAVDGLGGLLDECAQLVDIASRNAGAAAGPITP